jgi:hypothetical protein
VAWNNPYFLMVLSDCEGLYWEGTAKLRSWSSLQTTSGLQPKSKRAW